VTRIEHARVAPGVSRFEISRRFDGEDSTVTFQPKELRPFSLRYHFARVIDDEGRSLWLLRKREWYLEPEELEPWTPQHERTLAQNAFAYRRYAESLIDVQLNEAGDQRRGMLTLVDGWNRRTKPEDLDDFYYVALRREVEERQRSGEDLQSIAPDLGMSRTKLWRRLTEGKSRGI
jgi:hypothetical protein